MTSEYFFPGEGFTIKRNQDSFDSSLDPFAGIEFHPPLRSDALFDALRRAYPKGRTHGSRIKEATIGFLVGELELERSQGNTPTVVPTDTTPQQEQSLEQDDVGKLDAMAKSSVRHAIGATGEYSATVSEPTVDSTRDADRNLEVQTLSPTTTRKMKTSEAYEGLTFVWNAADGSTRQPRSKRTMTEVELAEYRLRRLIGACNVCKPKKRKCTHVLKNTVSSSANLQEIQWPLVSSDPGAIIPLVEGPSQNQGGQSTAFQSLPAYDSEIQFEDNSDTINQISFSLDELADCNELPTSTSLDPSLLLVQQGTLEFQEPQSGIPPPDTNDIPSAETPPLAQRQNRKSKKTRSPGRKPTPCPQTGALPTEAFHCDPFCLNNAEQSIAPNSRERNHGRPSLATFRQAPPPLTISPEVLHYRRNATDSHSARQEKRSTPRTNDTKSPIMQKLRDVGHHLRRRRGQTPELSHKAELKKLSTISPQPHPPRSNPSAGIQAPNRSSHSCTCGAARRESSSGQKKTGQPAYEQNLARKLEKLHV